MASDISRAMRLLSGFKVDSSSNLICKYFRKNGRLPRMSSASRRDVGPERRSWMIIWSNHSVTPVSIDFHLKDRRLKILLFTSLSLRALRRPLLLLMATATINETSSNGRSENVAITVENLGNCD